MNECWYPGAEEEALQRVPGGEDGAGAHAGGRGGGGGGKHIH